jgi:hypothetical protein
MWSAPGSIDMNRHGCWWLRSFDARASRPELPHATTTQSNAQRQLEEDDRPLGSETRCLVSAVCWPALAARCLAKSAWVQLWLANEVADALAAIATPQQLDFKSAAPAALPAALHRGRRSGTPVPRTDIEPPGPIVGSCLPCLRSCSHNRRTPRHRAPTGDESTGLAR